MSLSYHKRIHNSIKFYLISLCLIISNHHLPCPFPLLGTDCPRFAVTGVWFRKGICFRYVVLLCQSVYVGIISNKRVKFAHNCLIPCAEGGGLFSCSYRESFIIPYPPFLCCGFCAVFPRQLSAVLPVPLLWLTLSLWSGHARPVSVFWWWRSVPHTFLRTENLISSKYRLLSALYCCPLSAC